MFPDRTALLNPQLFGSVAYYAAMAAYGRVAIDTGIRYDKRFKSIHRYRVADTRGELSLTVPVGHPLPDGPRLWSRTLISDHGNWPHVHLTALESAYGRTPYFEFYVDRLRPLLQYRQISVVDFCLQADAEVRRILDLPCQIVDINDVDISSPLVDDLRRSGVPEHFASGSYWQVRQTELGFIPGLSILDLIFNLGPEAVLHISKRPTRL